MRKLQHPNSDYFRHRRALAFTEPIDVSAYNLIFAAEKSLSGDPL